VSWVVWNVVNAIIDKMKYCRFFPCLAFIFLACAKPSPKDPNQIGLGEWVAPDTSKKLPDNHPFLFGEPLAIQRKNDNKLIFRELANYYISFNTKNNTADYVAWHLDQSDLSGCTDCTSKNRPNPFYTEDQEVGLPYLVTHKDYTSTNFNRGHLCPAADRKSSKEVWLSTFYMTNMIPQAAKNNGQTWGNMENAIRDSVALKNMEAYIFAGAYGVGGTHCGNNNGGFDCKKFPPKTVHAIGIAQNILVPSRTWKIVLLLPQGENDFYRVNEKTTIIVVDAPNVDTDDLKTDWTLYATTLQELEAKVGYRFLAQLPTQIVNILKEKNIFKNSLK